MDSSTLSAAQALAMSSSRGVKLDNITQTLRDRLREIGLASDFEWEPRSLDDEAASHGWRKGPTGRGWRKADIDYSDIESLQRYKNPVIRVYFKDLVCNAADTKLVVGCIRHLFLEAIVKYRRYLRHRIVLLTADPQDINSFAHKALRLLVGEGLCDLGSVFVLNPENDYLVLRATTGLRTKDKKKDVFYVPDDKSWTRRAFEAQSILVEHKHDRVLTNNTFGEELKGASITSRLFLPLTWEPQNMASRSRWQVSGVFRLLRTDSRQDRHSVFPQRFTWLDAYLIDFVGEVTHVILQGYLSSWWAHSLVEKIVHGIKSGVDGSLEQIRVVRLMLFGDRDAGTGPLVGQNWFQDPDRRDAVEKLLMNAEFFLLDASEQVGVVTDDALDGAGSQKDAEPKVITRLFSDVLQKAVNLSRQLSVVNNIKYPPQFNSLKDAGAATLPAVYGDDGLVLSVFRNLVENSIKYAQPGKRANIEFSFEITNQHVRVVVDDDGIGVPEFEEKSLFTYGFRGRQARDMTLKGRGIGLAYCKKIMEHLGGDVEYRRKARGSCFVVTLKRSDAMPVEGGC